MKNINVIINNILRNRLQNIKNALSSIQQIIYQIKNKFLGSNINTIAKLYQTKIKSINVYDSKGDKIFKNWNILNNNIFVDNIDININIDYKQHKNGNTYLSSESLLKFINKDDIVLHYIIEQFIMLLDINTDNYTKVNLAYLIINIIFQIFRNLTNFENAIYDINVKKFYHQIFNKSETSEFHEDIDTSTIMLSDENMENLKEKQDNKRERNEALDIEQDIDNTDDFGDENINIGERE